MMEDQEERKSNKILELVTLVFYFGFGYLLFRYGYYSDVKLKKMLKI